MGRETTSTVWISDDGTIEGEATSPGNKPLICRGSLLNK
jgi:hypothetical protein